MRRSVWILAIVIIAAAAWLSTGGYTSFAQFNYGKMRDDIVGTVQDAQENTITTMGSVGRTPDEPAGGEVVPIEDIPEDRLRDAIAAVNEFRAIAGQASNRVRAYISKIKIKQRTEDMEFEPGKEPWLSSKHESRYSPFDPITKPVGPPPVFKKQPPFLPPIGGVKVKHNIDELRPLIKLRMTMQVGDEYLAYGEMAGLAVEWREGDVIDIPDPTFSQLEVVGISIDGVMFQSAGQFLNISFSGPGQSTEEAPFEIEIG